MAASPSLPAVYLGTEGGDQYLADNPDLDGELAVVRIEPQRWLTVDYGKDAD